MVAKIISIIYGFVTPIPILLLFLNSLQKQIIQILINYKMGFKAEFFIVTKMETILLLI